MNKLDSPPLLERLHALHDAMRDALHAHMLQTSIEVMSASTGIRGGDTVYALDTRGEEILLEFCADWGRESPFLLVAEGLHDEQSTLAPGRQLFGCAQVEEAQFIMIVDPIDGTRPLMYDKRSAWILTGIAPNLGDETNLSHIEVAMQTELPTTKMLWADRVWAVRGQGTQGNSTNMMNGEMRNLTVRPSQTPTVEGGYAMFCKFFTGSKGWLAQMEEELIMEVLGPPPAGHPQTFDDQYISNAGQLFDLMTGRDRFNAELRPLAHEILHGDPSSHLCSHPYDLCGELIAREAGVIVTNDTGGALDAPLDVESPVGWIAYANRDIQRQIEPTLLRLIHERRAVKQ
jgi:hypothetical protein